MITHPLLEPLAHGFFGRDGGVSTGDFATLNVSLSQGDDPAHVEANRAHVAGALGFAALCLLRQVHSTTVRILEGPPEPGDEADAMVTRVSGLLLGILTADCAPVLFADPDAGVIGAAHAGWKGACGGIVHRTVNAMVGLGADQRNIRAVIGPTISGANYEIGPDTAAQVVAVDPAAARHVAIPPGRSREHFEIPGLLLDQLRTAGLEHVASLGACTYAAPDRWFSHRYATHHGTRTGRQVAVVGLR